MANRLQKLQSAEQQTNSIAKKVERLKNHTASNPSDVNARLAFLRSLQSLEVSKRTLGQAHRRNIASEYLQSQQP